MLYVDFIKIRLAYWQSQCGLVSDVRQVAV